MQDNKFVSLFKINNKPILAPIITEALRKEILEIRNICKKKEEELKQKKDYLNYSKKIQERCDSAKSYTISDPVFPISKLPEVMDDNKIESDNDTIDAISIQSEVNDDVQKNNDVDIQPECCDLFQPNLKHQMKNLIDKQKEEYLTTMDILKKKFLIEQQKLFIKLQNSTQSHLTSTPLTNNSFAVTEDEDFAEFQTCLQSSETTCSEKTLISESNMKEKAATKINALARGYLVRRLMKTVYVQDIISTIQDTLNFVFGLNQHKLGANPLHDMLLKKKLFKQLRSDLRRFNDIFNKCTPIERMRIISNDRTFRRHKIVEKRSEYLNRSF